MGLPVILSDREILEAVKRGEIIIEPFDLSNVGPCSVDLTLSDRFLVFTGNREIDPMNPSSIESSVKIVVTGGKPFVIKPKQFVLAMTRERIALSKSLAATLEGKSSVARLGLIVHAAGLVNPGTGLARPKPLVLEVFCENTAPVKLYPGMKIVQIIFHRLSRPAEVGYDERPTSHFAKENRWIVAGKGVF